MKSSYDPQEVTLLLKDITGQVTPQSTQEREVEIQKGRHYCEMLPLEYEPTAQYLEAYDHALRHFSQDTADAVGRLCHKLNQEYSGELVLVSLARAGIPVGILVKRYMKWRFSRDLPHYALSIIRDRGIDRVALAHILKNHSPQSLVFVDGWTGKGAIFRELEKELQSYPELSPQLAVLADPAHVAPLYGTQKDILIPSSCLNATVSGLISRTFHRNDIISPHDFHGAHYYENFEHADCSHDFLDTVTEKFQKNYTPESSSVSTSGMAEVQEIAQEYDISNINFIKPGIGEATRVLLRRIPWKILIKAQEKENPALRHIIQLAKERNVPIEYRPMDHYLVCGIIKNLSDI